MAEPDPEKLFAAAVDRFSRTYADQTALLQGLTVLTRLALRLQGMALVVLGLGLLAVAWIGWQHVLLAQEHRLLAEQLRTTTQALTVQTELLRQHVTRPAP